MDSKKVAMATDIGGRPSQQDTAMIDLNLFTLDGKVYDVFGIFDGHGRDTLTRF
jgi:serine/threonine protein phosphatase PrpC